MTVPDRLSGASGAPLSHCVRLASLTPALPIRIVGNGARRSRVDARHRLIFRACTCLAHFTMNVADTLQSVVRDMIASEARQRKTVCQLARALYTQKI
jgi:hypothetical protein